jgi:hypothetical protein
MQQLVGFLHGIFRLLLVGVLVVKFSGVYGGDFAAEFGLAVAEDPADGVVWSVVDFGVFFFMFDEQVMLVLVS